MRSRTQRVKKRPLPLPLPPIAPTAVRASSNQKIVALVNAVGRRCSASAHARNLDKLQLHLPKEVVYYDLRRQIYHSHIDFSGWYVTDATLQQLQLYNDQNGNRAKSSFHSLTLDKFAQITARGLECILKAAEAGGGTLCVLRLNQCQLLSLSGQQLLDSSSLPRSLTELDVSSCEWVDDNFLRTLARHCSSLTHLSLARCRRVTDYGIAAFSEVDVASPTFLDVSYCSNLTDTALLVLLMGSSSSPAVRNGASTTTSSASARLRVLNAAGLSSVDGLTLVGLRNANAARLENLNLSCCTVLRVAALQQLARVRALVCLTKLDLTRCFLVNDQCLTALSEACPHLAILLLAFCSDITDFGLRRLVGDTPIVGVDEQDKCKIRVDEDTIKRDQEVGCQLLRILDITGCIQVTSRGIISLGTRCPLLQSVTLDGVRRLNDFGVRALLDGCSKLHTIRWRGTLVRSNPNEAVNLGACAAFLSIPHVTQASLTALASSCLEVLHIGTTQCDTNALATALLRTRTSSSLVDTLTDLDVTSVATDSLCEALGKCCNNLRILCLSRSRNFSTTSLLAVLRGCSRLRILDIGNCEQIDDEAMIELSKAPCCSHLETLLLANDWQITDIGVAKLVRPATSLFRLDVRHCPEISLPVLQALAAARGHISKATRDGLTPRHPNVVAFLRRELVRQESARKIAGWLRRHLNNRLSAKNTLERALTVYRRHKSAAACIQRWYRCMSAKKLLYQAVAKARCLRAERCKLHWAWIQALCILSCRLRVYVRMFLAARERAAIEKFLTLRNHAATEIQRLTRGWLERRRVFEKRQAREAHMSRAMALSREESIALVQKAMLLYRTYFVAGQHMQRIIRGFLGRQKAKRCEMVAHEILKVKNSRSKQIQRAFRAYMARVAFQNMMFCGASALQKVYRGFCGRNQACKIVLTRAYAISPRTFVLTRNSIFTRKFAIIWARKRDAALIVARTLQKRYRGYCGRRRAHCVLAHQRQYWYREDAGSRTIQHFFRTIVILVRLARIQAYLYRRRHSATKIQATWRMWLAKVLALTRKLRTNRHQQHTATMDSIVAQHQDRRLFLQRGAVHLIVSFYRASLAARGWQSPTSIRLLHHAATQIQALIRGHFGRVYACWCHYELARAASIVQRIWRGKQGKKMWRFLMEERQQLRHLQIKNDKLAWLAQKQIEQYALEEFERETQHAVVLQRWFGTLKKGLAFHRLQKRRDRQAHIRAKTKMAEVLATLTESVVSRARVWHDCMARKAELKAMNEANCKALGEEIEKLKGACIKAHAGSIQASEELTELKKRKQAAEHSITCRMRATEEIKQRIQPFAMRAKQLTIENAHVSSANRQLQMKLFGMRLELQKFHAHLQGRLSNEPLLMSKDVELLLNELADGNAFDNENCDS